MTQEHKWYVLNVHSGKEEFVAEKIKQAIATMKLQDYISDIYIPKQSQIAVKEGKKIVQKKRMLPGYIFVKMLYNEQSAPLLTNIEEVRGFVRSGSEVYPIPDEQIQALMNEKVVDEKDTKTYVTNIRVNDAVKINDGIFKGTFGKVSEVDAKKGKLKVLITMLGQEIPYQLSITEVEKL